MISSEEISYFMHIVFFELHFNVKKKKKYHKDIILSIFRNNRSSRIMIFALRATVHGYVASLTATPSVDAGAREENGGSRGRPRGETAAEGGYILRNGYDWENCR